MPPHDHEPDVAALRPRILVLREGRAGDTGQLLALADALGFSYEPADFRRSVAHVLLDRLAERLGLSVPLPGGVQWGPPWPDLLLASGGRAISTALQVRRHSRGHTRVVVIGRPWSRLAPLDLVITTPQYRLPEAPNVLHNLLPLNTLPAERLAAAAERWRRSVAHLPEPFVAVVLGGASGSFRFTRRDARSLARHASAVAGELGGSVLATSSPRTPQAAVNAFEASLSVPHQLHRWSPGQTENPYLGYLALAQRILVTGESASMIAEAVRTGKPVATFALTPRWRTRLLHLPLGRLARALGVAGGHRRLEARLTRSGLWIPPRDLGLLHRRLREVAAPGPGPGEFLVLNTRLDRDLERARNRVLALLGEASAEQTRTAVTGGGTRSGHRPR